MSQVEEYNWKERIRNLYGSSYYRNDIQGLRALGAIIIMVFHIWFNKVSGGVDIFIVVSGFLITGVFIRGWLSSGNLFIFKFWSNIIARITPSAYIVLFFSLILGYFLLAPTLLEPFVKEVIAAALQIENYLLIRRSVDYLASDLIPSPVQQFWALSVQVQFYAILPFILILLLFFSKKRSRIRVLISGYSLLFLLSFLYAYFQVNQNQASAYFNTFARGWEFLAGGILFLISPYIGSINEKRSKFLAIFGIFLIFCSAILIPKGADYPGPIALVPVTAALLIILSGLSFNYSNRLLSSKFMSFLGGISFTIYLWHWPLLIFYKELFTDEVPLVDGLVIIFFSILLAYLSKLLEDFFRKYTKRKVLYGYLMGGVFFTPVVGLAYYWYADINRQQAMTILKWESQSPFEEFFIQGKNENEYVVDKLDVLSANKYASYIARKANNQNGDDPIVLKSLWGKVGAERKVVLVGGSHAFQWLLALHNIGMKYDFEVINITKNSCPLGPLKTANVSCRKWNDSVREEILRLSPNLLITNSTRTDVKNEYIPEEYLESFRFFNSHDIPVMGIRDNPRFSEDPLICLHKNRENYDVCAVNREEYLQKEDPALKYQDLIYPIDMTEFYCGEEICPIIFRGHLIYMDSNHLNRAYVALLSRELEKKMRGQFPMLFSEQGE